MKKRIIALILIVIAITFSTTTVALSATAIDSRTMDEDRYEVLQRTLFRDVIPEIKNMFGEYARVEISEINVADIEFQVDGNDKLTLILEPFTGPHDYIGKVEMIVMVGLYETTVSSTKVLELYS